MVGTGRCAHAGRTSRIETIKVVKEGCFKMLRTDDFMYKDARGEKEKRVRLTH